ncbi:MAG: transcription-repair coupling factor [Bacilli bacterium]|nr:transcription-repair coupling factor [Bacilli bacterium]
MNEYLKLTNISFQHQGGLSATDEFFCVYLDQLFRKEKGNILLVTNSLYEANKLYSNLAVLNKDVVLFPMDDFLTSEAVAISPDLEINRLETLNEILLGKKIVVTNLTGYLRFLPTPANYKKAFLDLNVGDIIPPIRIVEKLIMNGYKRESFVTKTGEFSAHGDIVDVFILGEDNPIRIEFFGDEIERIKYFDPDNQKTFENIKRITIKPRTEFICSEEVEKSKQKYLPQYEKVSSIYDYLDNPIVFYKNHDQIENYFKRELVEEMFTYHKTKDEEFKGKYMFDFSEIIPKRVMFYESINNLEKAENKNIINYDVKSIPNFSGNYEVLNNYVDKINPKKIIVCLSPNNKKEFNKKFKYECKTIENNFWGGFLYNNILLLTEKEIYGEESKTKKYNTKFRYASKIKDINKLEIGDYVVHDICGIGIYKGIKTLLQNGVEKDYIEVQYQGKDKLYIPVEKIEYLSKYSTKEGVMPRISKMNGLEWKKTKARVDSKIADMMEELMNLYVERESIAGYSFSRDDEYMKAFEKEVPFDLTEDQKTAIIQIKNDMESTNVMDRLLCGDVGFGKTEVAFVAAFKAILDSKQVLFLCPTTILSGQHFENAKERFKNFPVNIALLNRFTPKKEESKILEQLSKGGIDLVIGTHRLLSEDVKLKDLGLLIIDEEQRFGVAHKEKLKKMKKNVDVLTLSATPIPRTLQMSLTGVRSLSLIETPPVDRYPVQTYVIEENDQIIKDAIYKELSRKGQVFILYNRIDTIERCFDRISKLAPDASITYAHGRMSKKELESRMEDFIGGKYDILICTTIIEAGIDIPNVNTLIVYNADNFGLSQLYQLRGRVGRSNRFAYAYLMYKGHKVLTETAIKRLQVLKDFTELGSGFSIASRDLAIRGAGDILGSEQAGFIDSVGVDLYLKMLNRQVALKKGIAVEEDNMAPPLLNVKTHIDESYADDQDIKIEIHRKINEVDSLSKFKSVKKELEDRFGRITKDMEIYMYEEWFEKLATKLPIRRVIEKKNSVSLILDKETVLKYSADILFVKSFEVSDYFRFKTIGDNLEIILDLLHLDKHPVYYLVEFLEKVLN